MAFSFVFPTSEETVLENGIRLVLLPDHEQEGLVVNAQFPFGRFCDPPSKEGISEMVIALLQKGTHNCPFDQFSEILEYAGASLSAEVGEEHTGIGIRMLSSSKDEILPLFIDMIRNPRLEAQEFSRIQKEMITSLQAETVEPSIIANRHFYVQLVGKDHPAGRFHSIDAIRKLQLDDVKSWYNEHIVPANCVVIVAGDFDPDNFRQRYLSAFKDWTSKSNYKPYFASAVTASQAAFRLVDKPDTTQTTLVIGHTMTGEISPDRNNIALANYVFGAGNFSSRLMTSIRSKVGRTYGISSQVAAERFFGAFTISTSTQNSQLALMVDAILEQFNDFCKNGIREDELEKAKRFAIGNMAFQLEGIGNVAEKLLWLRFYDYPNSFVEQFDQMINKITIDAVNASIKSLFSPEKLIVVAVGKKSEIGDQLKKIGDFTSFHFRDKV